MDLKDLLDFVSECAEVEITDFNFNDLDEIRNDFKPLELLPPGKPRTKEALPYKCGCGGTFSNSNIARHRKSIQHKHFLDFLHRTYKILKQKPEYSSIPKNELFKKCMIMYHILLAEDHVNGFFNINEPVLAKILTELT